MSSTQHQHSVDNDSQKLKPATSSTLYLDDQFTHLVSQYTKKTKSTKKIQHQSQKKSKLEKVSTSLPSSSKPSFIETRSPKSPSTYTYAHQDLGADKVSIEKSHQQTRSKVCIRLPTILSTVKTCSSLGKAQSPKNLLNTPLESINWTQVDSSIEVPFEIDQLVHKELPLNGIEHSPSKFKSTLLSESPRRHISNFYPIVIDKRSNDVVKQIQAAWGTFLEQKCSKNGKHAENTLLYQSNPKVSTLNCNMYATAVEKLFSRDEQASIRRHETHNQVESNSISKSLVANNLFHQSEVFTVDVNKVKSRSLSAPYNYCNRYNPYDDIKLDSSVFPYFTRTSLSRPHTVPPNGQYINNNHSSILKKPRRRAIRELIKSLSTTSESVKPLVKTISAPIQQTSDATPQMHVLIDGQNVPVIYSSEHTPFISRLRSTFSCTDLEFGFTNSTSKTSTRKNIKLDINTHIQVQKEPTETDTQQQQLLESNKLNPPNQLLHQQQVNDQELQSRRRNILINNVCSKPLEASSTKNLFCSPINFSQIEREEDCTYEYNTMNNSSTKRTNLNEASLLEKRSSVLKNNTLRRITDSLKELEVLQKTRKSNRSLVKTQLNSVVANTQHTKIEDTVKQSPQVSHSPRKITTGYSSLDRTLTLRDLVTHFPELETKHRQDRRKYTTINSVSSALPQTAKSSRFFTFNA